MVSQPNAFYVLLCSVPQETGFTGLYCQDPLHFGFGSWKKVTWLLVVTPPYPGIVLRAAMFLCGHRVWWTFFFYGGCSYEALIILFPVPCLFRPSDSNDFLPLLVFGFFNIHCGSLNPAHTSVKNPTTKNVLQNPS